MISPTNYNKRNLISIYLDGKVKHFPVKDPSITLEWYDYTIKQGETLYSIAERVFGKNLGYMWTYIADNNPIRYPDEYSPGDIIRLPKIIIRDSDTITNNYKNATTVTTSI